MKQALLARRAYLLLLLFVVALDQASKVVVDRLLALHESHPIVGGLLDLTYVRNRGAAFGLFSDSDLPYQAVLFSVVSGLALFAIAAYSCRLPAGSRLPQSGLALIMGGAIGNLLDRAARGYVIDFVDAYWGVHHWPAFNVADSAISIGVALLILDLMRAPRREAAAGGEMAEATPD